MFSRLGLLPIVAAAAMAVAGCEPSGPANNAASAESNGASENAALAQGAPTGGVCGGLGNVQCASAADFCKTAVGQCGTQDVEGVCTTRPGSCTQDYRPVCGCDGRTYGNACQADMAGVNVEAEGECLGAAPGESNSAAAQ